MKYLFSSLGSLGYLYPLVGLAKTMKARGHEVAFVTHKKMASVLEAAGIDRIPKGLKDGESFLRTAWGWPQEVIRQMNHLDYACDLFQPDVLVRAELTVGPMVTSHHRNIPLACLGMGTYIWPKTLEERLEKRFQGEGTKGADHSGKLVSLVSDCIGKSCEMASLPWSDDENHNQAHDLIKGHLYMLRSCIELEGFPHGLPDNAHFVGSCIWDREHELDADVTQWLDDADQKNLPVIYVQHGGPKVNPDFWPNFVKALTSQPVRILATMDKPEESDVPVPENFMVRETLPEHAVLRRSKMVVGLGKSSTMLGALSHGLPLLLFPLWSEHPHVAARCEMANVATCLSPHNPDNVTVEKIREAAMRLLDDTHPKREAAFKMGQKLTRDGYQRAAILLETLAAENAVIMREDLGQVR